jgi:hypothetical protein
MDEGRFSISADDLYKRPAIQRLRFVAEGELRLPMDLGIIGRTSIDRTQGGLDAQWRQHPLQFRRYSRVDPQPAKRNAALCPMIEMGTAAMITHAEPDRAAVGDMEPAPAMTAAQETGQ